LTKHNMLNWACDNWGIFRVHTKGHLQLVTECSKPEDVSKWYETEADPNGRYVTCSLVTIKES
jgi:hypothetical protein